MESDPGERADVADKGIEGEGQASFQITRPRS